MQCGWYDLNSRIRVECMDMVCMRINGTDEMTTPTGTHFMSVLSFPSQLTISENEKQPNY